MLKRLITILLISISVSISSVMADENYETDELYRALVKSVDINDFTLMAAQYHKDAVVVSPKKSELLSESIKRWKMDGEKLYANGGKAVLRMRFKERVINKKSAYETGIYHYQTIDKNNKVVDYYSHFADLNVKIDNQWQVIMERNVKRATSEEFNNLPQWQ